MSDPAEHRRSPRVSVDLPAEIDKQGTRFQGTILNCSLSGIFVRTPEKLRDGDIIEVIIHLPGIEHPIVAASRVIWTDWNDPKGFPGFGMNFVSLNDEQAILLRTFLYD